MRRIMVAIVLMALVPMVGVLGQAKAPKTVKRAQPPKFSKSDTFYADAFREGLVGERPADLSKASAVANSSAGGSSSSASPAGGGTAAPGAGWSKLISAATIEDTIKGLKLQVDQDITT